LVQPGGGTTHDHDCGVSEPTLTCSQMLWTEQKSGPHAKSPAGGVHDRVVERSTPPSAAWHALSYVAPSHPHAGGPPEAHDCGTGWHVPAVRVAPQAWSGQEQYCPTAHGKRVAHTAGGLQFPWPNIVAPGGQTHCWLMQDASSIVPSGSQQP
jgi:hypothetical protein